jgi:subtilase family serine protease
MTKLSSVSGASFEQTPDGPALLLGPGHTDLVVVPDCTRPDLTVTQMTAVNAKKNNAVLTTVVVNVGTATAGASETTFRVNGVGIAVVSTPALAPGASITVSAVWNLRGIEGPRVVSAVADSGGVVPESNESNNTTSLPVLAHGGKLR